MKSKTKTNDVFRKEPFKYNLRYLRELSKDTLIFSFIEREDFIIKLKEENEKLKLENYLYNVEQEKHQRLIPIFNEYIRKHNTLVNEYNLVNAERNYLKEELKLLKERMKNWKGDKIVSSMRIL